MYNVPRTPQPTPASAYAPPAAPPPFGPLPRRYSGLRFVASTCVVSAWVTLGLSILGGLLMMSHAGLSLANQVQSVTPGLGGETGGSGASSGQILNLVTPLLSGMQFAGGVVTIVTGVGGFLLLLAIGLLIYVVLDMEENTRVAAQAMAGIARRMGMPGG